MIADAIYSLNLLSDILPVMAEEVDDFNSEEEGDDEEDEEQGLREEEEEECPELVQGITFKRKAYKPIPKPKKKAK